MKATIEGVITEFFIAPQSDPKPGDLCLVAIGDQLLVGHYYPDSDGADWIEQPDRVIQVEDEHKKD